MTQLQRGLVAGLLAAMTIPATTTAAADAAHPLDRYASAERMVPIDGGRRLNLRCNGSGAPTVVLEAGGRADSLTWRQVQPLLAKRTTVCSYDRAGYGFSDGGPLPRDLDADVRDLHALVDAAGLATPLVLVGHSLGSNIARRYAEKHADTVAGLVLVDPSPQGTDGLSAEWRQQDEQGTQQRNAFLQRCAKAAEEGALVTPVPELQRCIAGPDPSYGDAVNAAIRANKLRPAFWQTLGSELASNVALFATPVSPDERHGDLPLVILVAADAYAQVPESDREALQALGNRTVDAIAASSTRSAHRRRTCLARRATGSTRDGGGCRGEIARGDRQAPGSVERLFAWVACKILLA